MTREKISTIPAAGKLEIDQKNFIAFIDKM